MKSTNILAVVVIGLALISGGCGASDSVKSISLTGVGSTGLFEVYGEGGTLQLFVTANYNSGKQVDVTNQSTFVATPIGTDQSGVALPDPTQPVAGYPSTPPSTISISNTGLVTAVQPFFCTFVVTSAQGVTPIAYAETGSYQIQATYQGMTSNYQFLPVASAATDSQVTGATCGPSPSTN